jgi:hypothetical protein
MRGRVHHRRATIERALNTLTVRDVADDNLDRGRISERGDACDLGRVAHQQPHCVSTLDETRRNVRTDETRSSGYQYGHAVTSSAGITAST